MAKIVLALFDDREQAETALEQLESEGFPSKYLQLKSGDDLIRSLQPPGASMYGAMFRGFFQEAGFLSDEDSSDVSGISPTDVLLTVETVDSRAERAAEIMNDCGAIDFDERVTDLGGAAAREEYGEEDEREAASESEDEPRDASPLSEDEEELSQRRGGGVRIYTWTMAAVAEVPVSDETESLTPEQQREFARHEPQFQSDWQAKYACRGLKYEDVRPGYEYGYRLGRDPRNADRDWSAVEAQAQSQWNHERGPWERFKDAVRSGWERGHHS